MLLIRCSTFQFDDDYKNTTGENYTIKDSPGYINITRRIEKGLQQIIKTDKSLTLKSNITFDLKEDGMDNLNRTKVQINIVISTTGNTLNVD